MNYKDLFRKVSYVNKDDPSFVSGASPAISAENLNAMQDGIIDALSAADTIASDVDVLYYRVDGVAYCKQFNNVVVPLSDWVRDAPYPFYPFKITLDMPDVVEAMIPEVVFNLEDATSGIFAPVSEATNGGIVLYATKLPKNDVIIPTIFMWLSVKSDSVNT